MMSDEIRVEVAYADPQRQVIIALTVPAGTTVGEAVALSGIAMQFAEIDLAQNQNKVGIFGKLVRATTILCDRDRVEIYRRLLVDPKGARRERARRQGGEKRAGKGIKTGQ